MFNVNVVLVTEVQYHTWCMYITHFSEIKNHSNCHRRENRYMLQYFLLSTEWAVLGLRTEETASKYEGQLSLY
jgi:hypothetical protein